MLLHLQGRTHTVYTGCCLIWLNRAAAPRTDLFCDAAEVTFAAWPENVLRAYAATGECDDKAGSYAIQGLGTFLVSEIKGQWSTIVGLPVQEVAKKAAGRGRDCCPGRSINIFAVLSFPFRFNFVSLPGFQYILKTIRI